MNQAKRPEDEERSAAPAVRGESFGPWLRSQREGRQIALREIADESKISLRYLQALEEDRFDLLPAPVFAKGFLRHYARYVGLDPEEVVTFYLAARQAAEEPDDDDDDDPQPATGGAPISGRILLLIAFLLLALVAVLWFLADRRGAGRPAEPAAIEATPAAAVETAAPPAIPPPPSAVAATPEETAAPAAVPAAPAATGAVQVTLDFVGECWVQARVDGARALSETRIQGESLQLTGEREVELTFGDGGAVRIEVNGMPLALDSAPGQVIRGLVIDRDTVRRLQAGHGAP